MPPPAFGGVRCPPRGVAAVRRYLCASVAFSGLVLAAARFHRPTVLSVSLLCCGQAPAKAPCPLPLVGAVALAVATLRQSLRSPVAGPQFPRSLNPRSLWSRPSGFGESGIGLRPLFCFIFTDLRFAHCRDKPKQSPPASIKCRLRQWRQTRLVLPTASRRRGRMLAMAPHKGRSPGSFVAYGEPPLWGRGGEAATASVLPLRSGLRLLSSARSSTLHSGLKPSPPLFAPACHRSAFAPAACVRLRVRSRFLPPSATLTI